MEVVHLSLISHKNNILGPSIAINSIPRVGICKSSFVGQFLIVSSTKSKLSHISVQYPMKKCVALHFSIDQTVQDPSMNKLKLLHMNSNRL